MLHGAMPVTIIPSAGIMPYLYGSTLDSRVKMVTTQALQVPGYQVLQYLGSGARSTIWQIRERKSDKLFALKRVVKRQTTDTRFLEQAQNEFAVGSTLHHPVIRKVYENRRIKRWLALREIHLVMELCQGRTLHENRPESVPEVIRIFCEVADALAYMNVAGYVHADMKPNNVIVSAEGTVKLIDLGQSCPRGTVKQRIQGTPDFIAPEQVKRRPLDERTDVFNFGAALYWTLTGKPIPTVMPKKGPVTLVHELVFTPAHKVNPEVPRGLSKLIIDCVQLRPTRRATNMAEVSDRLRAIGDVMERFSAGIAPPAAEAEPDVDAEASDEDIEFDDDPGSDGDFDIADAIDFGDDDEPRDD